MPFTATGPLWVSDQRYAHPAAGIHRGGRGAADPGQPDFNGARQEGAGLYQVTQKARRALERRARLSCPSESRPNLEILTDAMAERVLFDRRRATGASPIAATARRHEIRAGAPSCSPPAPSRRRSC
jgi:choline dehydrogenase-like flavoprotein